MADENISTPIDNITLGDTVGVRLIWLINVLDGLTVGDPMGVPGIPINTNVSDGLTVGEVVDAFLIWQASASDNVTLGDTVDAFLEWQISVSDALGINDTPGAAFIINASTSDGLTLGEGTPTMIIDPWMINVPDALTVGYPTVGADLDPKLIDVINALVLGEPIVTAWLPYEANVLDGIVVTDWPVGAGLFNWIDMTEITHMATQEIKFDWTSAAGGDAGMKSLSYYTGYVNSVWFVPDAGTTQPSDNYDVTLTDDDGNDVLTGFGADLTNAATVHIYPEHATLMQNAAIVETRLMLNVTNAGDSKGGIVYVYIKGAQ